MHKKHIQGLFIQSLSFYFFLFSALFSSIGFVQAQNKSYLFPVNPGKKSWLTGNFAEIRGTHFHAGLDIAANPGTPVKAAANGYVYRLKASTYGYGNAIYLYHPLTKQQTLYGHLQGFAPKIDRFVKRRQYQRQDFFYEEYLKAYAIPVKKGEIIGYVGNTGASGGPHLHFEVRTLNDVALNPFRYRFKEVGNDKVAPIIRSLALKTLHIDGRVNDRFGRFEFKPQKVGYNRYRLGKVITINGKIGLELLTHDLMNRSRNTFGTTKIKVVVDGQTTFESDVTQIDHHINKAMRVHADYARHARSRQGFQRCYVAEGNPYTFYKSKQRGILNIQDAKLHRVAVYASDYWGNTSVLTFSLRGKLPPMTKFRPTSVPRRSSLTHQVMGNTLIVKGNYIRQKIDIARFNVGGLSYDVPMVYMQGYASVYLWDLRLGLPDYVEIGRLRRRFNFKMLVPSNQTVTYQEARLEITFPRGALFDTLYLETQVFKNSFQISNAFIPLFKNIQVRFKPLNTPRFKKGWHIYRGNRFINSRWEGNTIVFEYDKLGGYKLRYDKQPPTLRWLRKSLYSISFKIRDNLSGIKNFKATLNGKFLLMKYEHKAARIWSAPATKNQRMKGNLVLTITDKAGNVKYFKTRL
mgnify:CR=1 FL=1